MGDACSSGDSKDSLCKLGNDAYLLGVFTGLRRLGMLVAKKCLCRSRTGGSPSRLDKSGADAQLLGSCCLGFLNLFVK